MISYMFLCEYMFNALEIFEKIWVGIGVGVEPVPLNTSVDLVGTIRTEKTPRKNLGNDAPG